MKLYSRFLLLAAFVIAPLFFMSAGAAELIEPTRSLEGEQLPGTGRLTVLSEPPGLEILLDGNSLGNTPAFMVEIQEGVHTLQVKDAQTDIFIEAGKTVKISLHKNEFILIPVKEKPVDEQPVVDVSTKTRPASTTTSRDPIREKVEKDRRRSQQRWQKFLDGTKPTP